MIYTYACIIKINICCYINAKLLYFPSLSGVELFKKISRGYEYKSCEIVMVFTIVHSFKSLVIILVLMRAVGSGRAIEGRGRDGGS